MIRRHQFDGLAAEQAIIQLLNPGDEVLVCDDTYGGTGRLFRRLFAKYDLKFHFIDMTDLGNVKALFMELAADGKLETPVKQRLRRLAWGLKLPGVELLHEEPSLFQKLKGIGAMLRIVLFGR